MSSTFFKKYVKPRDGAPERVFPRLNAKTTVLALVLLGLVLLLLLGLVLLLVLLVLVILIRHN